MNLLGEGSQIRVSPTGVSLSETNYVETISEGAFRGHYLVVWNGTPMQMVWSNKIDATIHLMQLLAWPKDKVYFWWAEHKAKSDLKFGPPRRDPTCE